MSKTILVNIQILIIIYSEKNMYVYETIKHKLKSKTEVKVK